MRKPQSISSRLFLWVLLAGLLALCAGGAGLYLKVRSIINASFDHSLQSDLEIFSGLLHVEDGDVEFEYTETVTGDFSIPRSGHYYQIFLGDEILTDSISLVGESLRLAPDRLVLDDPAQNLKVYTGVGPAGEPLRIMQRTLLFGGLPARIVVAHSRVDSLDILGQYRNFLLLSGALSAFFVALIGWWISRRALQPLHDFTTAINRIGEKNLAQRIDADRQFRELGALATAFNGMLDRLCRSLRAREELLAEVSHELKTPVAVIRSHCDVYLQRPRPTSEYVEALEVIRQNVDRMGYKIRRLLNLAQTESELLNLSGFPPLVLASCVRRARLTVEPLARERRIEFSEQLSEDLLVAGHAERLTEAFACLLENAVKYNRSEGTVRIVVEPCGGQAQLRIEDSGCGIDPQDLDRIFTRFYRGSRTQQAEGTGLGLALAKIVIEAHNGEIEAHNLAEGGSCFSVRLPLA